MAIIYNTTMSPGKLDLLRDWLPGQPRYLPGGRGPSWPGRAGFGLMTRPGKSALSSWW